MPDLDALARDAAVIVPATGWETLTVTGPDRLTWLDGLVTCELKQLSPGAGTWGLALSRLGKIQSVIWVVASADALWLALAPGTGAAVHAELERMLIMEDAELAAPGEPRRWFSLHGPEAAARAAALAAGSGGVSAPIDFTGLGGAALCVPEAAAAELAAQAGERLLGSEAWQRLRLERALPEHGVDFDGRDRPHEAALDRRAVSWTKGCYLGQEVVCMQDMRGKVKRSLRVLAVDAPREAPVAAGGAVLRAEGGEQVGAVTSVAYSERAGSWLAMAKLELDAMGAPLAVEAEGQRFPARPATPC